MQLYRIEALIFLTLSAFSAPVLFATDQAQLERGQRLYNDGVGSAQVMAGLTVDDQDIEVPAETLPCAGCHGSDRLGRSEDGVTAPNVQWSTLTEGRDAGAYTRASLVRVISTGIDPQGNKLVVSMPRYRMSQQDMLDLIAYLTAE